jgi:hypothetical protein
VDPLGGAGDEARIDGHTFAGQDLTQEIGVMFEIDGTGAVLAMEIGREADAGVKIVAGIVEEDNIPTHVHVTVRIAPGGGHDCAQ